MEVEPEAGMILGICGEGSGCTEEGRRLKSKDETCEGKRWERERKYSATVNALETHAAVKASM